jgi:hypothetical protein
VTFVYVDVVPSATFVYVDVVPSVTFVYVDVVPSATFVYVDFVPSVTFATGPDSHRNPLRPQFTNEEEIVRRCLRGLLRLFPRRLHLPLLRNPPHPLLPHRYELLRHHPLFPPELRNRERKHLFRVLAECWKRNAEYLW